MIDNRKFNKQDSQNSLPLLSENDLTQITGGAGLVINDKNIITGSHSCKLFQKKDGLEQQNIVSECCSYCKYKGWEETYMVCTHKNST